MVSGKIAMVAAAEYEIDARIRRQAEALARRGAYVEVFCLDKPENDAVWQLEGVTVHHLRVAKYRGKSIVKYTSMYIRFFLLAFWQLTCNVRRFDLVQFHSMPEWLVFAGAMFRIARKPIILDIHDLSSELYVSKFGRRPGAWIVRWLERLSLRFADRLLTVHEPYAELIRTIHPSLGIRDIAVAINAPDPHYFSSFKFRNWTDAPVFSYHGTFAHRFGVVQLVDAFRLVLSTYPEARLELRGGGDARQDLVKRIHAHGLQSRVKLSSGPVPVSDLAQQLGSVDIGVAPVVSNQFTRWALPTKVLDCIFLGIPVVATDIPVLREYFDDSCLFYVPPGDASALAEGMTRAAMSPTRCRERASRAAEAARGISWPVQEEAYIRLVESAL